MYSHRVYNGFEMKQYTIELKINIIVFLKWVVGVLFTVMVFFFCIFALDVVMDYAMVKTNPGIT